MKKLLAIGTTIVLGFALGYFVARRHLDIQHEQAAAELQKAWQAERVALEQRLEQANSRPAPPLKTVDASPLIKVAPRPSPADLIEQLGMYKSVSNAQQTYALRRMLHHLEELVIAGPAALPAIREFLNEGQNGFFFVAPEQRNALPANLRNIVPQTLRLGLLEAAKRIGGPDAEALLAQTLEHNGRSEEIMWLALTLQEIAPDKYRDQAIAAARRLTERPASPDGKPGERDAGYRLLEELRDTTYVTVAQQQIIRADGQIDVAALKYVIHSLGQNAVPLAAQLYDDPRITDPQKKEPFARVALNYVGADAAANDFYVKAINDTKLSNEQRKNLIEDLNQNGFANRKNLSQSDLPLINNRMTLIEQLVPTTTDPVNLAAMKEAYKDLVKMRERITTRPAQ